MSLSCRIMTFPRSIAAGIPAFWNSPTTGPGLKGVSPARTQRSSGAISPPRAGARVFVASSSLKSRKGLMSAVTTAVCPSIVSLSLTSSGFFSLACCSARRSRLFFATVIVARPESFAIVREILRGQVPGPDRRMERPLVAAPHANRVPQRVDQVCRVRRRRHGPRHPPSRSEDDAEALPDDGHEGRFRDEEVVRRREGPCLSLAAGVLF